MLSNFFRITIRNLWKNKSNSFLNIFGLAVGIACAGLIFLWVEDELRYDAHYQKKDRLYQVLTNQTYEGKVHTFMNNQTPGPLAAAIKSEVPGVSNTCRFSWNFETLFNVKDKGVYQSGYYVDRSALDMFGFEFIEGDKQTAFTELYSIIVTEKMATSMFGQSKGVLGREVKTDNRQSYVVTGVIRDLPSNSTLQFDWLSPFEVFYNQNPWLSSWRNNSVNTYMELSPSADPSSVNKSIYNIIIQKSPESLTHPFLFSMNDWRLRNQFENGVQSGGRIEYIRMFTIIAWIILLIACINFMNLATARSEKRAREVGVRKVLGAQRRMLILQFIGEAICMALVAVAIGALLIALVLPAFNQLVEKSLGPEITNPTYLLALFTVAVLCGTISGSYPAIYLSSFNPIFVFKGIRLKSGSAALIRKGLVVVQFSVSIVLIISTIIIYQQISHVKSRDLGYNRNNLLQLDLRGEMANKFSVIKQDLISTGLVENVALNSYNTIYSGNNTSSFSWKGKDPGSDILVSFRLISPEFLSTAGIKITDGRDFMQKDIGDSTTVLISESLAKLMGPGSAIGKTIQAPANDQGGLIDLQVAGVFKDYVYGDMYGQSDPVIFMCMPAMTSFMFVRSKPTANTAELLSKMEAILKQHNPAYPFTYTFVDDQFDQQFKSEVLISKLSRVFVALAIIISCLGLFGLAAYTAERRTKEIGIRRVLGASVSGITSLLSKEFMQLVAISALISFPLAWWAMSEWLQNYNYRIDISGIVFVCAGCLAMIIALCTISFQTIRVALMNPVKSLRTE